MLLGRPLFTTVLRTVAEFRPRPQCLYICGTTGEKRSEHIVAWEGACEGVTFARLLRADRTAVCMSLCAEEKRVALRSGRSIAQFLGSGEYSSFYLDVTGLPHHVWAPFLRGILRRQEPSFCIYVEPGDYQHSETPTEAAIFDLSDRIEGIAPLPGFVSFPRVAEEEPLFVPLLGFEGARFAFYARECSTEAGEYLADYWSSRVSGGVPLLYVFGESSEARRDTGVAERSICRGQLSVCAI